MIAGNQLSVPATVVDDQGTQRPDSSRRELLLDSAEVMPILENAFLVSSVLTVNHEESTFSLAPARASAERPLQPILKAKDTCEENELPSGEILSTNTASAVDERAEMSAVAKVGAAVSAVAGIIVITWTMFYFVKRRRQCRSSLAADKIISTLEGSELGDQLHCLDNNVRVVKVSHTRDPVEMQRENKAAELP